jgi:uncharacterized damage-inducible protein DinB
MNPYAKWIEGKDALAALTETPVKIGTLLQQIGMNGWDRTYAPGKWNVRQIMTHLAQCELIFGARFRQAVTQDDYVVQPFDQDQFMTREPLENDAVVIQAYESLRLWNLALYRSFTAEERARQLTHPERGAMTVQQMLEMVAGHDLNHLAQLEAIAAGK